MSFSGNNFGWPAGPNGAGYVTRVSQPVDISEDAAGTEYNAPGGMALVVNADDSLGQDALDYLPADNPDTAAGWIAGRVGARQTLSAGSAPVLVRKVRKAAADSPGAIQWAHWSTS